MCHAYPSATALAEPWTFTQADEQHTLYTRCACTQLYVHSGVLTESGQASRLICGKNLATRYTDTLLPHGQGTPAPRNETPLPRTRPTGKTCDRERLSTPVIKLISRIPTVVVATLSPSLVSAVFLYRYLTVVSYPRRLYLYLAPIRNTAALVCMF